MTALRFPVAAALALLAACSGRPVPQALTGVLLTEEDFAADPQLRATLQDTVLVQLHRADAPNGTESGPVSVPYAIGPDPASVLFCWDDEDGVPHAATLVDVGSNSVAARALPGQACSRAIVPPGEYSLILQRGDPNRTDPADEVVFIRLDAADGPALVSNSCRYCYFLYGTFTKKSFENVSLHHALFCGATMSQCGLRGVDLSDAGNWGWGCGSGTRDRVRWTGTTITNSNLDRFASLFTDWNTVTFTGVSLRAARIWYSTFTNTSFVDSWLENVSLRTLEGTPSTTFVDTTFLLGGLSGGVDDGGGSPVKFSFTRGNPNGVLFKGTAIGPIDLGRTEFEGGKWIGVGLSGLFRGGHFLGTSFDTLSMFNVTFDGTVFDGCSFSVVVDRPSSGSPKSSYSRLAFRNMNLVAQYLVEPDFFRGGIDYTGSALTYDLAPPVGTWKGVTFTNAQVAEVPRDALKGRDLTGWQAGGATFTFTGGAPDLSGSVLVNAHLYGWQLQGAALVGANFTGTDTTGCRFDNADFTNAVMPGVSLKNHDLSRATMVGAKLDRANLSGASAAWRDFTNASLVGIVADASTVITNFHGATFRTTSASGGADLREANLSTADLSSAFLSGALLAGARMVGTDFTGADLVAANLSGNTTVATNAIFRSANLAGADLSGANLGSLGCPEGAKCAARLNDAWMCGANLAGTDLRGAILTGAYLPPFPIGDESSPDYCAPVRGIPITDGTTTCPSGKFPAQPASGCSSDDWRPGTPPPVTCCVSRRLPDGSWSKCPPRLKKGEACTLNCDCQSKLCPAATKKCQ